ncbi:uncharacterized protein [Procambarus clarkii]|uniref:uncharacterized protein n=1 Tax=Procambarus clarkii TaxID=6728 RepID=UPI0037420D3E
MPHITILPQNADLALAFTIPQCYGCEAGCSRGSFMYYHCPICPSSIFQPTTRVQVMQHLQNHFYGKHHGNVHAKGYMITKCQQDCFQNRNMKRVGHYHCPHCEKMFSRADSIRIHIEKCNASGNDKSLKKTSVKCPECQKLYAKNYLKEHIRQIHRPRDASLTAQKHLYAVSIDGRGIYAVSKTFKGPQHPIHVKRVPGSHHPGYCEVGGCNDIFQTQRRNGNDFYECDHLMATYFCVAGVICDMSLEKLANMLSDGYISSTNHNMCKASYEEALKNSQIFVVSIPQRARMSKRYQFWSVYTGTKLWWCKFQRTIVTLDCNTSAIWCRCKHRSCWHRSVVRWWLYQTSGASHLTETNIEQDIVDSEIMDPEDTDPENAEPDDADPEDTDPEDADPEDTYPEDTDPEDAHPEDTDLEHTSKEESSDECIDRKIQYMNSMKTIPCGISFPKFSVEKCPQKLIPSETTCHFCHSTLGSPQLVSRKATVVDNLNPPCKQFETFCKMCPTCHMKYRYAEIEDGIFNFNDSLLVTYSLMVNIRALLLNHTSISRTLSAIEYTYDITVNHQELENAYLAFEALCDHNYEFTCFRCGHHPKLLIHGLTEKATFSYPVNNIQLPNSPAPEIDINKFWDKINKELVARCFLKKGMRNPYKLHPSYNEWAPYIGPYTRKSDLVHNTEYEKVNNDSEYLAPVAEDVTHHSYRRNGGWVFSSCPHNVTYALKCLLKPESPSDYVDILASLKHVPTVNLANKASNIAKVADKLVPGGRRECNPRSFGSDSVVCVCDASYCDLPGRLTLPDPGHYTVVTSSREGLRFHTDTRELEDKPTAGSARLVLDVNDLGQTMLGFGGAFTDAAGINMAGLSAPAQDLLLRSYFDPEGVEYELCRVPIAGTDFSVRPYSYNDDVEDDINLEHFALAEEDRLYKVPVILRAQELSERPLRLLASPWAPPAWMKTNGKLNESGELLPEMRQPWSHYLVRFVKEYEKEGIAMWGLTTQNHPTSDDIKWNSCEWKKEDMRDWIKESLGPTLEAAGLGRLKVMVGDENRDVLPEYPGATLSDPEAARYVDGVAVHWYTDALHGPEHLDHTHQLFPDKFIIYTESCIVPGLMFFNDAGEEAVVLGSWSRAESYAASIIQVVNHHVSGWVDWNLALDMDGGPNWASNQVDAPIIVNKRADEFYKQPMFYVMGHFSKFVVAGSRLVPSTVDHKNIHTSAFLHPDGHTVLVLLNTGEEAREVSVGVGDQGVANLLLPAKAIQTVIIAGEQKVAKSHSKTKYTSQTHCLEDDCH